MKKLILSLAVAGLFTASASAQESRLTEQTVLTELKNRSSAQEKAAYFVDRLNELCTLSAGQKTELQAFTEAHFAKRIAAGLEEGRELSSVFDEGFKNEAKRLLTAEQIETLKAYSQKQNSDHEHHHGHDHNHDH